MGEQLLTLSPPPDLESPNTDLASAATAYSSSLRDWADAAVASLAGDPAGDDDALGNAVKEWLGEYGIACATLAARATGDSITADLGCPEFVSVLDLLCIDETGESCGEPTVVTVAPDLYATIEQLPGTQDGLEAVSSYLLALRLAGGEAPFVITLRIPGSPDNTDGLGFYSYTGNEWIRLDGEVRVLRDGKLLEGTFDLPPANIAILRQH